MNIILAGMPGCGKTTVSKTLGAVLGCKVVDTDEEIIKKYGPITEIFARFGESAFRAAETETVKKVCNLSGVVVSTGGGCLLSEENVTAFKKSGKIVFLRTGIETLLKRVKGDTSRPLLQGGAEQKMRKLFEERTPVYERAADYVIDTDGLSPEEAAKKIAEMVKL